MIYESERIGPDRSPRHKFTKIKKKGKGHNITKKTTKVRIIYAQRIIFRLGCEGVID